MSRARPRLVIGVGNAFRRDDGAGLAVADRVAALAAPDAATVEVRRLDGEGVRLLDLWEGHDDVVLVDAASGDAAPGTVLSADGACPLPSAFCRSTHAFGVAEALALARALGRLPRRLTVLGVVGRDFGFGPDLSPPVRAAVERLAERLARS